MNREDPRELIRKAEKKLNPGFFGKFLGSESGRIEESIELYNNAANIYKLNKEWEAAGQIFEKCGELDAKIGGQMSPNYYNEAAHCYSFVDKQKQIENLDKCITLYQNKGKFQQAGKIAMKIATDFESQLDYKEAIAKYEKAPDLFSMESMNSRASMQQCQLKVADLLCISKDKDMFEKAPKLYETLGMQYLSVPLLKTSAKDVFFKCVVCYLAKKDEISAGIQLKKFLEEDPTMCDTRESKFLEEAIECVTDPPNPEGFKKAVADFKTYRDLDKWKINMFATVLENIECNDDEDLK